ncbi:MAG: glycosyltransferase [Chlorobi bacterium]|nr:glycosyltransferase [Chlorobiota bacterium]
MRILLTNSIGKNKWGGGEKWMILAARGLKARGYDVAIGSYPGSVIEKRASENNIPTYKVRVRSDISIRGAFNLAKAINDFKPDVIIGLQNRDILIAGVVTRFTHTPVIIARHGVKLLKKNIKHKIIYSAFSKGIFTNTKTIKEIYDSYNWWPSDFVKVIYNGVELPPKAENKFDFSTVAGDMGEDPKIIVSIGRLSSQKGYKYLIKAASGICKKLPGTYFFIIGRGREEKRLKALIKKLGLENNMFILPFRNDINPLLASADLFVLPSLYEGMPNVLLEAMASKVPVICSNINGVSDIFENEEANFLIPPADALSLERTIYNFLTNKLPEYDVEKAYQMVVERFSVDSMLDELENYIKAKVSL